MQGSDWTGIIEGRLAVTERESSCVIKSVAQAYVIERESSHGIEGA